MPDRQQHRQEVETFLREHIAGPVWELELPPGSGHETYFARCGDLACFVKLNVQAARYQVLAADGVTPPVLAAGALPDGTSIIVQPYITGRRPTRRDFQIQLEQFAAVIRQVHASESLKQMLAGAPSGLYRDAGLQAWERVRQKWEACRAQVPASAEFIDRSLRQLRRQVQAFQGAGLAASHNDICNSNWLIQPDGRLYLVDLEAMSLDDPAFDLGALLWWYVPPALRGQFLTLTGHADEAGFAARMRVRMALHCLDILLPRPGSFDVFDAASFADDLVDFRAVLAGNENPQGYDD